MASTPKEFGLSESVREQVKLAGFSLNAEPWAGPAPQDMERQEALSQLHMASDRLKGVLAGIKDPAQRVLIESQAGELMNLLQTAERGGYIDAAQVGRAVAMVEAVAATASGTSVATTSSRMAISAQQLEQLERKFGLESIAGAETYEEAMAIIYGNYEKVRAVSDKADAYYAKHGYETVLSEEEKRRREELRARMDAGIATAAEVAELADLEIEDAEGQIDHAKRNGLDATPAEDKRDVWSVTKGQGIIAEGIDIENSGVEKDGKPASAVESSTSVNGNEGFSAYFASTPEPLAPTVSIDASGFGAFVSRPVEEKAPDASATSRFEVANTTPEDAVSANASLPNKKSSNTASHAV